ncbi:MAG: PilZ domain-containing protein [Burkholderiales bacterium]
MNAQESTFRRMRNRPNAPDQARQQIRRRDERRAAGITALLHCHGRFQTSRVVDFSLGGLQMDGCFGVAVADRVAVELLSGQRLEGKVAWAVAGRIGVQLHQPLAPDHPVVALLSQVANRA